MFCIRIRMRARLVGLGLSLVLLGTGPSGAQEAREDVGASEPDAPMPPGPPDPPVTGFGGPTSVGGTLDRDAEVESTLLSRYFAFKDRLSSDHGLGFGVDYFGLYQKADSSPGEDDAAGGVLRVFGRWALVNRTSADSGSLVGKVESRHRLGTTLAPQDLGFEIGYAGLTAVTFSDIGWALTNLYWEQKLLGGRLAGVVGYVDSTDYVDVHALVDPWSDFSNLAFTTNPTIPVPNQGLGLAVRVSASDNVYVVGGLADANGDPTDPGGAWSSFFDTGEHFSHVEVGWISSYENRFTDNVHLTAWQAEERPEAGVSSGWGVAASWSWSLGERWRPFARAGYGDGGGGLWERSVSVGAGCQLRGGDDLLGFGVSWGRPSEDTLGPDLRDQVTAEAFYRWRPLRFVHVTPAVQLLLDPALAPTQDAVVVLGLRGRLSF